MTENLKIDQQRLSGLKQKKVITEKQVQTETHRAISGRTNRGNTWETPQEKTETEIGLRTNGQSAANLRRNSELLTQEAQRNPSRGQGNQV